MRSINALSLAPDAHDGLENSGRSHILHVFDSACNLIDERREVLSIVTPQIGNGPFHLVVEDNILFSEYINVESPVSIVGNQLMFGDLTINLTNAKLWNPRPDWQVLHARRKIVFSGLQSGLALWKSAAVQSTTARFQSLTNDFSYAVANADIPSALTTARRLAGLGAGLTPAGDDVMMGAVYAAWIIHPPGVARGLAQEIADSAAPLTTSLSAAWLKSAGKGEAGILWHEFFDALVSVGRIGNPTYKMAVAEAMSKILSVGETSGADALTGFIGTFATWAEISSSKTP